MVLLRHYCFFSLENAKNLGRSDDAKRRKKEDGLNCKKKSRCLLFLVLENVQVSPSLSSVREQMRTLGTKLCHL